MSDLSVDRADDQSRWIARIGDRQVGVAEFRLDGDRVLFTHTEVAQDLEGQGFGSRLVQAALDDVRSRGGLQVVPQCPFVRAWIEDHPDYADLLA